MPLQAETAWLRTDATGRAVGVDRENKAILGYVVAQQGPFKTPGRGEFDGDSLRSIVKLMKASEPAGLKSRFAHPSLSSDGIGSFLGRARNPRREKIMKPNGDGTFKEIEVVRADLHLDPSSFNSPNGNLGQYVMDLAESDPDALSSSLVLQKEETIRLDSKGGRLKDDNGDDLPPLWMPVKLHASDIVDTGDAVDGLLSAGIEPDELRDKFVRQGVELLNKAFEGATREVVEARVQAWLSRYLSFRFGDVEPEEPPPPAGPSVDTLRRKLDLRIKEISY